MRAFEVAGSLCPDLVRRVGSRGEREFIVTPFKYANGDFINVYIRQEDEEIVLSDLGATLQRLQLERIDLSEGREELVGRIIALHGLRREDTEFSKPTTVDRLGGDFISFCAAMTRLSNLEFVDSRRRVSPIPEQVESVVSKLVAPLRGVARNWVDTEIDSEGAYPVDYHFNTNGPPRNLFVVTTREKGLSVASICNFMKSKRRAAPALAVIDEAGEVTGRPLKQLRNAVNDICYGVEGREQRIVEFALGQDSLGPRS